MRATAAPRGGRRRFISCGRRGPHLGELFVTADPAPEEEPSAEAEGQGRGGFFRRLRDNMSKTRQALGTELQADLRVASTTRPSSGWRRR